MKGIYCRGFVDLWYCKKNLLNGVKIVNYLLSLDCLFFRKIKNMY